MLVRSSTPIPGASESLRYLQHHRIPFILLTNGGGKTEQARVEGLGSKLSVKLSTKNFIQSHTPFAELATTHGVPSYKDKCILVVGGDYDGCAQVARSYGFTNVVTPGDIFASYPEIWPFSKNFANGYYSHFASPLPRPINPDDPTTSLKIDAIFVYNDPRDWGLDIQLILDVLLSREGIMGTYSVKNGKKDLPNNGYLQDGQPPLYFSNPDLLWAAGYHLSRLGQGGFTAALEGVWKAVTHGAELKRIQIGKPYHETYSFAEKMLLRFREEMYGNQANTAGPDDGQKLKKVYMVGDNPESDIKGANDYKSEVGTEWISLLTRTGVYQDRPGSKPTVQPKVIVDDVKTAVEWALKNSGWHEDKIE